MSLTVSYRIRLNPDANLQVFGQELNGESYAICKSDMMIKGDDSTPTLTGTELAEIMNQHLVEDLLATPNVSRALRGPPLLQQPWLVRTWSGRRPVFSLSRGLAATLDWGFRY